MGEDPSVSSIAAGRRKAYRKSLQLPRTAFPMRARLAQNEPLSRARWEGQGLYRRLLEARAGCEPFVFHDGPPYANGAIHVGHLLDKVLKDLVVRSQGMIGRRCHFVPGWDCHGLPIEHRVMAELVGSGKIDRLNELPADRRRVAVRRACARYAGRFVKLQAEQMGRLLTLADYDDPYLTMAPAYEGAVLEVFAGLVEAGLVYRDLKPVHWSIAHRTALADAELEYREREDPSIYVRFDADRAAVAGVFGVELEAAPSLLIWTTTPWTLPANRLIAVHPGFPYALVRPAGSRRPMVVAAGRVEALAGVAGAALEVLAAVPGERLAGLEYRHPFVDGGGRVVAAGHVTLDGGTGLVHTAPGHGEEDYLAGLAAGEDVYSPVRGDGTFDDTVPGWLRGMSVWDADRSIVERLEASGHLFHSGTLKHAYPHDWRSKTPVILRATEQWFLAVDEPFPGTAEPGESLRQRALAACDEEIRFVPERSRNRLRGMLESRPDWCISRQRAWGLPIPAFRTPAGEVLLTPASVRAVGEVFARRGSDAWFTRPPAELLATWDPAGDPQAPAGLEIGDLEKTHDIFDVWFESGSSWHAVLRSRGLGFPADLYLEGSDQHRGWFQLSLLPSLGVTGRPPFRELVTHGFVVGKDGRKMSKSLGDALEVEELVSKFGAEVCRWWVSSLAFENDVRADLPVFELAGESYRKVRNTLRFLLGNLADFERDRDAVPLAGLPPTSLDAWVLARTAEVRDEVIAAYLAYAFRRAHRRLFDFCNETLSALYLDAVKDRLYCDRPDSSRRRATQSALRRICEVLCGLLAPILPHTADEAWRELTGDREGSVHLSTIPEVGEVAADPGWERVLERRDEVLRALEAAKAGGLDNPLDAGLVLPDPDGALAAFRAELPSVMGVSRVDLDPEAGHLQVLDLRGEPRCERSWLRDGTVRRRADGGWLTDRDAAALGFL